jgi:hypothetical protein
LIIWSGMPTKKQKHNLRNQRDYDLLSSKTPSKLIVIAELEKNP